MKALINGQAYDWASVAVSVGTQQIYGITSISWTENLETAPIYGASPYPIGYGYGKYSITGSMTIEEKELLIMKVASPEFNIHNLPPFPLTIVFKPEYTSYKKVRGYTAQGTGELVVMPDNGKYRELELMPFAIILQGVKLHNVSNSFTQNSVLYVNVNFIATQVIHITFEEFMALLQKQPGALRKLGKVVDIHNIDTVQLSKISRILSQLIIYPNYKGDIENEL